MTPVISFSAKTSKRRATSRMAGIRRNLVGASLDPVPIEGTNHQVCGIVRPSTESEPNRGKVTWEMQSGTGQAQARRPKLKANMITHSPLARSLANSGQGERCHDLVSDKVWFVAHIAAAVWLDRFLRTPIVSYLTVEIRSAPPTTTCTFRYALQHVHSTSIDYGYCGAQSMVPFRTRR
jgi:hypothetical protein